MKYHTKKQLHVTPDMQLRSKDTILTRRNTPHPPIINMDNDQCGIFQNYKKIKNFIYLNKPMLQITELNY